MVETSGCVSAAGLGPFIVRSRRVGDVLDEMILGVRIELQRTQ